MNDSKHTRKGTVRQAATERARQRRMERIRAARERENVVTELVIDVATNRAVASDAEYSAARGIVQLRRMGENQESIAELCEMTPGEVRAAIALVSRGTEHRSTGRAAEAELGVGEVAHEKGA
jgi:hypothetical protein